MEQLEKKTKRPSPVGIVLLVLLLIVAGAAGYLYYSVVKAPLDLDDPQQLAASVPMSPEERFHISAADQTVQVRMDAADLWSLILAHTGNDFLDVVNQELSSYGLSVSGCGIHMDEEGLGLDLELFYGETRLVAKVPCTLGVSGHHISLSPAGVKLGVVSLPVEGLLSSLKLEYDLNLPVIAEVTQVSFTEDALLLTGPIDIHTLVSPDKSLYMYAVFCESMQSTADSLGSEEGFGAILTRLEQDPGSMEALYRDLFTLADSEVTAEYLDSRYGLTQRFLPGIDFAQVAAEQTALSEQVTAQWHILEQFFTNLTSDYNEKKFRLSEGVFLYNWQPFQAAQYSMGKYDALFETLDPESVFLILVDAEDGFIRKTSSFYRMCDENQQFSREVDFNKTYILGCVLRSVDGEPFLLYEMEITQSNTYVRSIKVVPLTEEEASALQVPGKFGVWAG